MSFYCSLIHHTILIGIGKYSPLSPTHTHPLTHAHNFSPISSFFNTQTCSISHSLLYLSSSDSHTHSYTHTLTHTDPHSHTPTLTHIKIGQNPNQGQGDMPNNMNMFQGMQMPVLPNPPFPPNLRYCPLTFALYSLPFPLYSTLVVSFLLSSSLRG